MTAAEFVLSFGLLVATSCLQGIFGFGMALFALPLLALYAGDLLPQVLLLVSLPLTTAMSVMYRGRVSWRDAWLLVFGRSLATFPAVLLLANLPARGIRLLFGALTFVASGLLLIQKSHPVVRIPRLGMFVAGLVSGAMGTAGAVGGPPLAIAMSGRALDQVKGTLALVLVIGNVISLGGLVLVKRVSLLDVQISMGLLVAVLMGLALSRWRTFDFDSVEGRSQNAVLSLSAVAGLFVAAVPVPG